eukprot:TRINITY_DN35827_c0_g1_i1.p1 TRINITY_DN35827_c0_g1~~TRINITY_DN35827_c0_g1_i1.p1  ORF type:complete len:170 (-),score=4.89 TRINITY_DN35827_c0_g1_i1:165-674(-)
MCAFVAKAFLDDATVFKSTKKCTRMAKKNFRKHANSSTASSTTAKYFPHRYVSSLEIAAPASLLLHSTYNIGDELVWSWVSEPKKVQFLYTMQNIRAKCVEEGKCPSPLENRAVRFLPPYDEYNRALQNEPNSFENRFCDHYETASIATNNSTLEAGVNIPQSVRQNTG